MNAASPATWGSGSWSRRRLAAALVAGCGSGRRSDRRRLSHRRCAGTYLHASRAPASPATAPTAARPDDAPLPAAGHDGRPRRPPLRRRLEQPPHPRDRRRRDACAIVAGIGELGLDSDDPSTDRLNHPTNVTFDPMGRRTRCRSRPGTTAASRSRPRRPARSSTSAAPASAGSAATAARGDGDAGSAGRVVFDAAGNLLIADQANQMIRRVDRATDVITTIAGIGHCADAVNPDPCVLNDGGPATDGRLSLPDRPGGAPGGRIALDADGNIYVADTENFRLRRIDPAGIITTFAGTGTWGFAGDGGPATAAQLGRARPTSPSGADGASSSPTPTTSCVRVVTPDGIITTFAGSAASAGFAGDDGPAAAALLDRPYGRRGRARPATSTSPTRTTSASASSIRDGRRNRRELRRHHEGRHANGSRVDDGPSGDAGRPGRAGRLRGRAPATRSACGGLFCNGAPAESVRAAARRAERRERRLRHHEGSGRRRAHAGGAHPDPLHGRRREVLVGRPRRRRADAVDAGTDRAVHARWRRHAAAASRRSYGHRRALHPAAAAPPAPAASRWRRSGRGAAAPAPAAAGAGGGGVRSASRARSARSTRPSSSPTIRRR